MLGFMASCFTAHAQEPIGYPYVGERPARQRLTDAATVRANLRAGHTTQEDVLALYGAPDKSIRGGTGRQKWVYDRSYPISGAHREEGALLPRSALEVPKVKSITVIMEFEDGVLVDYKVRILTPQAGTGAVTRVMIESADGNGRRWTTVGVSANIIDASFNALNDGITWKLLQEDAKLPEDAS